MEKPKKKHFRSGIFALGLIALLIGFFLDHAKEIPLVERILLPKTYFTDIALTRLDNEELIDKNDPAFQYILDICPPSGIDLNTVTSLRKGTTTIDFTRAEQNNRFGIHIVFDNRITRDPICTSEKIRQDIKGGTGFIILGLIISVVGYLIK